MKLSILILLSVFVACTVETEAGKCTGILNCFGYGNPNAPWGPRSDAMSDEDDDNIKLFDDMEQVGRFKGRGHRYTRPSWNDMEHDMEQVGRFKGRGHRYTRQSWNDME